MPVRSPMPRAVLATITRSVLPLAMVAALLLTGLGTVPSADRFADPPPGARPVDAADDLRPVASRVVKARRALRVAKNQVGDPYRYGAAGPNAFDCSGLVYFSARRAGFRQVPRTSSAQSRHMRRIKRSSMRPGDYVFFTGRSGVYHAAIYVGRKDGRRRIVHAPGRGQRVKRAAIWTNRWFPGTLRRR